MAAGAAGGTHILVKGIAQGARGTLRVVVETDQGGHTELAMPYTVGAPGATDTGANPPSSGKGIPALAAPILAGAFLALVLRRRT